MRLTDWWASDEWARYERACGCEGQRLSQLASATWQTRIVDLHKSEADLWRGLRKSYRSAISRLSSDDLSVGFLTDEMFVSACLPFHTQQAGRQTRPTESWAVQADWIRRGHAVCAVGIASPRMIDPAAGIGTGTMAGFAYVVTDGRWAYYFSSASSAPLVMHAIQWALMLELKRIGVRTYELGWQGEATDEKGRNIEFFRRGFGGEDVPAIVRTH